jgi:hypothetical protein
MAQPIADYFNWLVQIEREYIHYNPDALHKIRGDVARKLSFAQESKHEIEIHFEVWGLPVPDLSQFDLIIKKTSDLLGKLNKHARSRQNVPV